ncbi:MAG TPA: hypothetical protein ENG54_03470, partial [Thermofilum sp.]|nr:hypothetical protein [Thermofilum sp.]
MVKLPEKFLKWNYYPRRRLAEQMLKGEIGDPSKFFLEFTRHNPVLCTAAVNSDGSIEVNGKVVGVGYVLKREILSEALKEFRDHMKASDEVYE